MSGLSFIFAYALTLIVETCMLFLLLHKRYDARTIMLNSMIANSITLPFVWFAFPLLGMDWAAQTAIAEIFAFMCEAAFYKKAFIGISWKEAMFVSLACNSLSFVAGFMLM